MTQDQIIRIVLLVIFAGLVLLIATFLFSFLLPIITPIILIILAYLIYRYLKTGSLPF